MEKNVLTNVSSSGLSSWHWIHLLKFQIRVNQMLNAIPTFWSVTIYFQLHQKWDEAEVRLDEAAPQVQHSKLLESKEKARREVADKARRDAERALKDAEDAQRAEMDTEHTFRVKLKELRLAEAEIWEVESVRSFYTTSKPIHGERRSFISLWVVWVSAKRWRASSP